MKLRRLVFLGAPIVALALLGACRRQDIRTVRIHVPEMGSPACAEFVVAAVRGVPGVQPGGIKADPVLHAVTVSYDSLQLSSKNIEFFVAEAGFRVLSIRTTPDGVETSEIPASAQARGALPVACRP